MCHVSTVGHDKCDAFTIVGLDKCAAFTIVGRDKCVTFLLLDVTSVSRFYCWT